MAKVAVRISGGAIQEKEASTVAQLKASLNLTNYTATVNGSTVEDSYNLEENEFVTFAPAVKGGC